MRPARDSRFIRLLLVFFFVLAMGYAGYEAQGLLFGPEIHLTQSTHFSEEAFVLVSGTAERITELRLNGAAISVRENGEFSEPYLLAPGSNRIVLEARDARGRTTQKMIDIVYRTTRSALPESRTLPHSTTTSSTTSTEI